MYPAAQGCLAVIAPVCPHPTDSNGVIVYDLRLDPDDWIDLSDEEIRARLFTSNELLPEELSHSAEDNPYQQVPNFDFAYGSFLRSCVAIRYQ